MGKFRKLRGDATSVPLGPRGPSGPGSRPHLKVPPPSSTDAAPEFQGGPGPGRAPGGTGGRRLSREQGPGLLLPITLHGADPQGPWKQGFL